MKRDLVVGLIFGLLTLPAWGAPRNPDGPGIPEGVALQKALILEAGHAGKPAWRPMLVYLAGLHGRGMHPARPPLAEAFEEVAPGYDPGMALQVPPGTEAGLAFGTIDLAYHRLDEVRASPQNVLRQTRNEQVFQQPDGMLAALVTWDAKGHANFKNYKSFVPAWVLAVDEYVAVTGDEAFLDECLAVLKRQIGWYESKRTAVGGGFYYLDIVQDTWESGMDEGIRYDDRPKVPAAAIDATSHVYMLYRHASDWSRRRGKPPGEWDAKAAALRGFIQTQLWDEGSGFFYDGWSVHEPSKRHLAIEGFWPMIVGAASNRQANRLIDSHLLNPAEFLTEHPVPTVAKSDPKFELRMWRGPTWNATGYLVARGCVVYGRTAAAHLIMERALDATAVQFERTHTIWEFYHPFLGDEAALKRKNRGRNSPCPDYEGHSPLFAMADLWRQTMP